MAPEFTTLLTLLVIAFVLFLAGGTCFAVHAYFVRRRWNRLISNNPQTI